MIPGSGEGLRGPYSVHPMPIVQDGRKKSGWSVRFNKNWTIVNIPTLRDARNAARCLNAAYVCGAENAMAAASKSVLKVLGIRRRR